MSYHQVGRAESKRGPPERVTEEPVPTKSAVSTVMHVFQINIASNWRIVTVLWTKNLMNVSFSVTVDGVEAGDLSHTCKVELRPWHFWTRKGYKTFDIDTHRPEEAHQLEVHWDLRSAKYTGSPEPSSDYYVALVSEEEIVLLLGDYKKKAYKRTKKRPALIDSLQCYKKEIVYAKKSFATRARFSDAGKSEHDVVVESSTMGPKDPEMWISIDGVVLIHVKNLQWKFRGNETVTVNKQPIQVLWDVHAWLFCAPSTGYGLFIFKPGASEPEIEREGSNRSGNSDNSSNGSMFYSTQSQAKAQDFCLYLHAWKIE